MSYLFHTDDDKCEMLAAIGVESIDEIINAQVPGSVERRRELALSPSSDAAV